MQGEYDTQNYPEIQGDNMASIETPTFLATGGNEGGFGGGVGLLLAAALLGGNGFNNRNHGGDCADNATLSAALAGVTDSQMNTAVLQSLGQIQAAIPLAEAQVQLALAGSTDAIRSHLGQVENAILAGQNSINVNVLQGTAASITATKDAQFAVSSAVVSEGEKTRALITANQIAELNRLAAERQDEIIELRNGVARDRDRHGIEINMINNQNQNQLQFQQQAQVLNTLSHGLVDALQSIRATNQAINIGAGTQVANPTNTNTNVKA